jgi:prolyl oligopeptidase
MKKILFLFASVALLASCITSQQEKITYPVTRMGNVVDTIFGTPVPDPYRWLEDDMSEETAAWVKEQNTVTFGYLEKIPFREQIKARLTQIWNYEKFSMPFREGDYIYFSKNNGLQNQYILSPERRRRT